MMLWIAVHPEPEARKEDLGKDPMNVHADEKPLLDPVERSAQRSFNRRRFDQ